MSNLNTVPVVFANVASTAQQGVVQLAGDLGGTSLLPSVLKINGVALPASPGTTGQTLIVQANGSLLWASQVKQVVTPTFAATLTPNSGITDIFRVTLTGALTIANPTGSPTDGQVLQFQLTQDSTGSRSVTFGNAYAFSSDVPAPVLTTTGNKADLIVFQYNATAAVWRCVGVVKGF